MSTRALRNLVEITPWRTPKDYLRRWRRFQRTLAPPRPRTIRRPIASRIYVWKDEMIAEQGGLCPYCMAPLSGSIQLDHIHPVSKGGTDTRANLCVTCKSCNAGKKDRSLLIFLLSRMTRR